MPRVLLSKVLHFLSLQSPLAEEITFETLKKAIGKALETL